MSDRIYTPDAWTVLRIAYKDEVIYKVMGGWYGGYLHGDSWQLNSGIVAFEKEGEFWLFHGHSGSTYKCHENSERMTGLMSMILGSWMEDADPIITIVPIDELDLEDVSV